MSYAMDRRYFLGGMIVAAVARIPVVSALPFEELPAAKTDCFDDRRILLPDDNIFRYLTNGSD